ncbi:MAG TPA: hypothetical protein PKE29_07000 [Phycisphaerales bacterium]|nr:hypothetical protein [Phycisphaerales bacterium]
MATRSSVLVRIAVGAAALAACLAYAPRASGVVVADPIPLPLNGYVGAYGGSTCVAVGSFWVVTARHVGGSIGSYVWMRGTSYRVVEIVPHPIYDVQLVRVAEELPGYHRLAGSVRLNDPCVLGGWGATAGSSLPNNTGFDWSGPHIETWGENAIEGEGNLLAVRYDAPNSTLSVPHEAVFAVNDSGAGLFVWGGDGSMELAGIAISVTGWGNSTYGSAAFALSVELFRNWMAPIVDPSTPISSALQAPRSMVAIPGLPAWMGGAMVCAALAGVRRRR